MTDQSCVCTTERVLAFVCGELSEAEELEVAEHLGDCGPCCDEAAEFRVVGEALTECCQHQVVRWHGFETPFGRMYVAAGDRGLVRVSWQQPSDDALVDQLEERFPGRPVVRDPAGLTEAERELREYFAGDRDRFDLPVDLGGVSDFDRSVLQETRRISYGQVVPYAELARRIGRPGAARAVGGALGRNPVAIVIPCHRVVRTDGGLGGYGGGVECKERLLAIEGRPEFAAAS